MPTAADVISAMDAIAPPRLALDGDPVGLAAGSPAQRVSGVLVALDATPQTAAEAKRRNAQMIAAHHPPFYAGLDTVAETGYGGALAALFVQQRLAVYAAHTNLDIAPGGVADALADAAGLPPERDILSVTGSTPFLKLAVFVPDGHLEKVRKGICNAGAGFYGEYSDCTFRVRGTGTFKGSAASNPYLGKAGEFEEADEYRLETRLPADRKSAVEAALLQAHPYEVPAYDFTRLEESMPHGLGRVGTLAKKETAGALAQRLARTLKAPGVQIFGSAKKPVRRVAVWSGRGAPAADAVRAGAEVLVTGECGYHDADLFSYHNLAVIRLGHGVSERVVLAPLAARLRGLLKGVNVFISRDSCARFSNTGS